MVVSLCPWTVTLAVVVFRWPELGSPNPVEKSCPRTRGGIPRAEVRVTVATTSTQTVESRFLGKAGIQKVATAVITEGRMSYGSVGIRRTTVMATSATIDTEKARAGEVA